MRREARTENNIQLARIQGYHEGGSYNDRESYAYAGFKTNKYFTSDRYIKLDEHFNRVDEKPLLAYGLEIETECQSITSSIVLANILHEVAFKPFPDDLFKLQSDGSLQGRSSAECITQPMSREFIRNHYKDFKSLFNTYFKMFDISAGSARCGMHVNISVGCFGKTEKAQEQAIRKLYYIVNKHFDFCCELFRRDRRATGYCRRMDYRKEYAKSASFDDFPAGHGVSYNLDHYRAGRIELRLVGGQRDFASFRNTMESVFCLIDAVKRISWDDCDDLVKIFSGCNQYVYDRIKTYCMETDTITAEQVAAIGATVERVELL